MRLAQGQLNLLKRCPRLFQYTYLDQICSPPSPEQQERQIWGSRFHLLMQQRELGLPINSLLQANCQMQQWMSAFTTAATQNFSENSGLQFRESEHYRTLKVQDYLLTVVYDLLVVDELNAQILDWKTYPVPQKSQQLAQNWQTLLYLYVLAETSNYRPEQITLTYWFIQSQAIQQVKFTYNSARHQRITQKLDQVLNQLSHWLQKYEAGEPFPQVPLSSDRCNSCQFVVRCERVSCSSTLESSRKQQKKGDLLPNLASIPEIPV